MAETRAALAERLAALKRWLFAPPRPSRTGVKNVKTKKSSQKSPAAKQSGTRKSTAPESHTKKGGTKRALGAKAQQVLGEVLTGAAVGAVRGAAKAVTETLDQKDQAKSKKANSKK